MAGSKRKKKKKPLCMLPVGTKSKGLASSRLALFSPDQRCSCCSSLGAPELPPTRPLDLSPSRIPQTQLDPSQIQTTGGAHQSQGPCPTDSPLGHTPLSPSESPTLSWPPLCIFVARGQDSGTARRPTLLDSGDHPAYVLAESERAGERAAGGRARAPILLHPNSPPSLTSDLT